MWESKQVETRHLNSVDELEKGTKKKLTTAQPGIVRNQGRPTPDDWDTSKEQRGAYKKHYLDFDSTVLVTSQEGLRRAAASNFIGHKKVNNEEYCNGIGAAPNIARNYERGTDQLQIREAGTSAE
jgi:hypothetical protein